MTPCCRACWAAFLCLWVAGTAAAELRIGVGRWDYDLAGSATDQGRHYDFERDLELQAGGRSTLLVELDPPRGPNWAFSYARMGAGGDHTETTVITGPLGIPITTVSREVTTAADFDDYELSARWPWTWGTLRWAGGLTLRRLAGTVLIDDSAEAEPTRESYDEILPQLHARVRWPLGGRLSLLAAGYGMEYDGNRAVEWRAGAELRFGALLLEGGWQQKRYVIDVEDFRLDATLDGALLRAGFVFG
jgi:hypothetical protein